MFIWPATRKRLGRTLRLISAKAYSSIVSNVRFQKMKRLAALVSVANGSVSGSPSRRKPGSCALWEERKHTMHFETQRPRRNRQAKFPLESTDASGKSHC